MLTYFPPNDYYTYFLFEFILQHLYVVWAMTLFLVSNSLGFTMPSDLSQPWYFGAFKTYSHWQYWEVCTHNLYSCLSPSFNISTLIYALGAKSLFCVVVSYSWGITMSLDFLNPIVLVPSKQVLIDNIEEFAPIIYTPTIGLVCQRYSGLFRRPRGMYFTAKDRGEMMSMIYNWPAEQVTIHC